MTETTDTTIIDSIDELTADWFTQALREGGTIGAGVTVADATSAFIGTGQLGSVIQTTLTYGGSGDGGPASVIVKLPSQDPAARQLGVMLGVFEAELSFYQDIAPRVGVAVPDLHWGGLDAETGGSTLVIEDLSSRGAVGDMVAGGTVEQATLALDALVALQVPSWNAPWLADYAWLTDINRTHMLFGGAVAGLPSFAERFGPRIQPDQLALAERLTPHAAGMPDVIWHPPYVVTHTDYRLDNMVFGTAPGAAALTVIDWQTTRAAPPLIDVAMFFASCLDTELRREHEQDLLRHYHEGLLAGGVTDFSFDDLLAGYRGAALFPLMAAVAVGTSLAQSERGDTMLSQFIRGAANLVADQRADELVLGS